MSKSAQNPRFQAFLCSLEKLQAPFGSTSMGFQGTPGAELLRSRVSRRWAPSLPRPSSGPGNRAQAASTGGTLDLLAMKRRQQAEVKPVPALGTRESRTGSQHRWNLWLRGKEALAARTGQTAGRMAVKRTQAARLEPWRAAIAPSKHCPTCRPLRCAQAAGTGGTFRELGTLHGDSPTGLRMAQRQTAQLKPWRIAIATMLTALVLLQLNLSQPEGRREARRQTARLEPSDLQPLRCIASTHGEDVARAIMRKIKAAEQRAGRQLIWNLQAFAFLSAFRWSTSKTERTSTIKTLHPLQKKMPRFLLLPSPGWEFRQETRTGVGLGVVWPSVRMNGWEIY